MDFDDEESGFRPASLVCLTPFASTVSPSPRRLSSCFTPSKPVKRQLAWVSLQGRLVGAEEATSSKTIDINGTFSAKQALAWELFTPIQRVLVVAVISASAANSKKNNQISHLQKSVQLRDQVLFGMQQKLDNLCEQLNNFRYQPEAVPQSDMFAKKAEKSSCSLCHHHSLTPKGSMFDSTAKGLNLDENSKYKMATSSEVEPDERRMSDLSDWAPSVASFDIQSDSLSIEHDSNSLRKECEEKDITIKKLSTFIQSSEALGSKRIVELEDIIRRKNRIINKLRKDILTLEQKVVNLTRLRRSSFPGQSASWKVQQSPLMVENVLYDIDYTTGPSSSSDPDSPPRNKVRPLAFKMQEISSDQGRNSGQVERCILVEQNQCTYTTNILKKNSANETPNRIPTSTRHTGENRSKRLHPNKSMEVTANKRWV